MARISTKPGEILSASLHNSNRIKAFIFIYPYSIPSWFIVFYCN